jgi:pyruvate/2-oxoglutarate dehydrogenase complex dihydrolipoamide acyltransferase (E2) component
MTHTSNARQGWTWGAPESTNAGEYWVWVPAEADPPASCAATASAASIPHASPAARRLARICGVPLETLQGSGAHQRITEEDVLEAVRQRQG